MDPLDEQLSRMRNGVREWVLRAQHTDWRRMREFSPAVLLSLLSASALAPILTAAMGSPDVVAAGIGVLSSVGGNVLSDVVITAVNGLRAEKKGLSSEEAERFLSARIEELLAAGDDHSDLLRAEIASVLEEIDAGGIVLRTAIDSGSERVHDDVVAVMGKLRSGFGEMGFLLTGIERASAEILERLDELDAENRLSIELHMRQLTEARLTREAIAALELRHTATAASVEGGPHPGPRWVHGSPYRGLVPFDESQSEVFYGRERLTAKLVGALAERVTTGGLIIATGASGAGKSSLLHAGLLPALARGAQLPGSDRWPRIAIAPARHPLTELAVHLAALDGGEAAEVLAGLEAEPGKAHLAIRKAVLANAARPGSGTAAGDDAGPLILVVDQFEQVFVPGPGGVAEKERQAFITALSAAADTPGGPSDRPAALVVIAVRLDYGDNLAAYPELAVALQKGQFIVGPMTEEELRLTVTGPADAAGLRIDGTLLDTITADLRSADRGYMPGVLPLLSQAMLGTWENRENNTLTVRSYERSGGVAGAIQLSAEAAYQALTTDQQDLAQALMKSMVAVGRNGQLSRRQVSRAALLGLQSPEGRAQVDVVLEAFAAKRLLMLGAGIVEIAHDALLDAWPRLRAWLEEDRTTWVMLTQVAEDAAVWSDNNRDSSFLYRGAQLAALKGAAAKWAQDPARYPAVSDVQQDFLRASTRSAARSARLRQLIAAVLVVLLLGSITGALVAVNAAQDANRTASAELSAQIAAESEESDQTDPVTASRLAAAAWEIGQTPQARVAMLDALAQPNRGVIPAQSGQDLVAFSPDGKTLATASSTTVQLWDVASRRQIGANIKPVLAPHGTVSSLAFSPDGKVLAIAGAAVELWNVAAGKQSGTVTRSASPQSGQGAGSGVAAVAFSPDGMILAEGDYSGEVQLWNMATRRRLGAPFRATVGLVSAVSFSPDGKTLATCSDYGGAKLWNVTTRRQEGGDLYPDGSEDMWGVTFSPDGAALATVSEDGEARLWDASTHQELGSPLVVGIGGTRSAIAFSSAGMLASVSQGGPTQLWDTNIYRQIGSPLSASGSALPAGSDGVPPAANSAAFDANGKILVTGSGAGAVALWNVAKQQEIAQVRPGAYDDGVVVNDVAFSPDGKLIAAAVGNLESSGADTVLLWDATSRRALPGLLNTGSLDEATALAFSPNGKTLAVADDLGDVRLWDIAADRQIGPTMKAGVGFAPKVSSINSVSFSPDGKVLATASNDGTARLWNVATGQPIGIPLLHGVDTVNTVVFSPDGSLLATGSSDGTIQLWDVVTRQQDGASFTSGDGSVRTAAFSPSGQDLATGSLDGQANVWDVATHQEIGPALIAGTSTSDPVMSVTFSPDGNDLSTAAYDGDVRLWDVDTPRNMSSGVCAIAGGSLTSAQWSTYVGSRPFQNIC